jgi:hypothetical protein
MNNFSRLVKLAGLKEIVVQPTKIDRDIRIKVSPFGKRGIAAFVEYYNVSIKCDMGDDFWETFDTLSINYPHSLFFLWQHIPDEGISLRKLLDEELNESFNLEEIREDLSVAITLKFIEEISEIELNNILNEYK